MRDPSLVASKKRTFVSRRSKVAKCQKPKSQRLVPGSDRAERRLCFSDLWNPNSSRIQSAEKLAYGDAVAAIPTFAAAQWDSRNQVAVPENMAVIISAANLPLHLSYFDSGWKEIQISPGATVKLPCRKGSVPIAFSDGSSQRRTSLATGTRYVLFWDDTLQHWDIEAFDSLLGGLKSN
jgi:hypothetical protein